MPKSFRQGPRPRWFDGKEWGSIAEVVVGLLFLLADVQVSHGQPIRGHSGLIWPDFTAPGHAWGLVAVEYLGGWTIEDYREEWVGNGRRIQAYRDNPEVLLVTIYPGPDGEFDIINAIKGVQYVRELLADQSTLLHKKLKEQMGGEFQVAA